MSRTNSPLRYPGGKSALLGAVSSILKANRLDRGHYVEPFAGGAGLALSLLYKGDVAEIHLNDVDPAVAAFWRSVLENPDGLVELIHRAPVNLDERERQRQVYLSGAGTDLDLGFATLYLNRVNRSGIIRTGGAIGGKSQTGKYLIDCRFNKLDLEARIRRIHRYRKRIHFYQSDAAEFIDTIEPLLPKRSLVYADPPYYAKGAELYTSSFTHLDHVRFRDRIVRLSAPWIVTYDDVSEIRQIYRGQPQQPFSLYYSAQHKRQGQELLISERSVSIPPIVNLAKTSISTELAPA